MGLEKYKEKRDFSRTSEPVAKQSESGKNRFVVQEHHASHLHWDFRLEMSERADGGSVVLKSWAVPKGIPENIGDKKLAIEVEDHPIDYITFEGIIPEGNYGAGLVKIWDSGKYELIKRDDKIIEFLLYGKVLNGRYTLIKTKGYGGRNSWLITKNTPKGV